jgi:predicted protein tyrosine phosphatase
MKTKILFICAMNVNRSSTAERVFMSEYFTRSAGIYNAKPVTKEQLEWADVVIVMEEDHRKEVGLLYPDIYLKKKIIVLDIPDQYRYMQPELIKILEQKMKKLKKEGVI